MTLSFNRSNACLLIVLSLILFSVGFGCSPGASGEEIIDIAGNWKVVNGTNFSNSDEGYLDITKSKLILYGTSPDPQKNCLDKIEFNLEANGDNSYTLVNRIFPEETLSLTVSDTSENTVHFDFRNEDNDFFLVCIKQAFNEDTLQICEP